MRIQGPGRRVYMWGGVYARSSPPNWKASTMSAVLWESLLKTGSLWSGEPGGGGGLWQGDMSGTKEKAVLEVLEEGGGDTLPREEGGEGVSALDPGPAGSRHRGRGRVLTLASSALWMKWHLGPYGQKPTVWKVRHSSVLYLGCLTRLRNSLYPCANWHLSPYLHSPLSS